MAATAATGSFTSVIGQGQPSFDSRVFTTTGRTVTVTLTNCTDNTAGKNPGTKTLTSVALQLYVGSPGESSALGKPVTHKCGSYSLGAPASGSPVFFEIHAINGDTSADRTNFLNADVSATY